MSFSEQAHKHFVTSLVHKIFAAIASSSHYPAKEYEQGYSIYLTLTRLMSYIYGAPILDVSRSHTTTQHSR